MHNVKEITKEN